MTTVFPIVHTRPKIGFIGVGWIGKRRMEALLATHSADVAAVFDLNSTALAEVRKLAPHAIVCEPPEMMALGLDGVVIATPNCFHATQARLALDSGISVFCQKPVGINSAEVRDVAEAARNANRLIVVDLSYRGTRALDMFMALVHRGEIGELYDVEATFHNAYGPDRSWYYQKHLSGGGCLIDLGTHLLDVVAELYGCPALDLVSSRLYHRGQPLEDVNAVEDHAICDLSFQDGRGARIECSWKISIGQDVRIRIIAYGSRGVLVFSNVNGSYFDFALDRWKGTGRERLVEPPDDWEGRQVRMWAERLISAPRFDSDPVRNMVYVADTIDRLYVAAQEFILAKGDKSIYGYSNLSTKPASQRPRIYPKDS